ncbi:MAG: DNA mismatch repair protein MutS, partial [Rikenellaceae bacterium]
MAKEGNTKVEKKYVETPLMGQYYRIKAVHPDAILLFRVGDFYETFGEDAIKASAILGITLTRRANGAASYVELAGFPHHSVETYLPKLVRAGERVAICEQLEDPKKVKGLVKRGVVELVTPGVVMEDNVLSAKENVYLAALHYGRKTIGIAFLDISTGEFYCAQGNKDYIDRLISNLSPKEVLYARCNEDRFKSDFGGKLYTYKLDEWLFSEDVNREKLCRQFNTNTLKGFGVEHLGDAISAAGAILSYIEFTEHKHIAHISSISRIDEGEYVWIDRFTIRNLELFSSNNLDTKGSFADVIDRTRTPMGGRLLRRWIALPLRDVKRLSARQDIVSIFCMDRELASTVEDCVAQVGDMERIAARVAAQRVTPRELLQLKDSLGALGDLKQLLATSSHKSLCCEATKIDPMPELLQRLRCELYPDPAHNQIQKGGIIASGVNAELDDLRRVSTNGKRILAQIQQREIERTGITSLKISYNNVFGYYIEVRNAHKEKVPEEWIRKQTLTSAERYITAELKEYEQKILGAEEKILALEQHLYAQLIEYISQQLTPILGNAQCVARLDVLQSFARMAFERRYVRPLLNDGLKIDIKAGRHPVIETLLPVGEKYIPNDVMLDCDGQQIIMITGPNMSGKSALLRQTALIILMAQIGSFVPAAAAEIGVVDKIFTRVGASDNISQGESTFMVEMLESASILK